MTTKTTMKHMTHNDDGIRCPCEPCTHKFPWLSFMAVVSILALLGAFALYVYRGKP